MINTNERETMKLLQNALGSGIINLDDVRNDMQEKERQRLLQKHNNAVFQDKDGRWKTSLPDPTKKSGRRLVAKSNKDKLEKEIIDFYRKQEKEEYERTHGSKTLRELYPKWIKHKKLHTKSPSYIKRINTDWNAFYENDAIADIPLQDLTTAYLDDWVHEKILSYEMTKTKYYNMSVILRQSLIYACTDGIDILQKNPFKAVKVNKELFYRKDKPNRKTQVFLTSEQKLVAKACSEKYDKRPDCMTPLIILLNFQLGLRIGELVALKWSDVGKKAIQIQRMEIENYTFVEQNGKVKEIPTGYTVVNRVKSKAGLREVPLNSEAKKILAELKKIAETNGYYDDDYIFISSQEKRRGNARTLTTYLVKLCKQLGILNKSNHKIRKTFISNLIEKNVNIDTVRTIAGHENEKTTLGNYCYDTSDDDELDESYENARNTNAVFRAVS